MRHCSVALCSMAKLCDVELSSLHPKQVRFFRIEMAPLLPGGPGRGGGGVRTVGGL